jgi:2-iminobutanoate/2-iminopropanoate deaminase
MAAKAAKTPVISNIAQACEARRRVRRRAKKLFTRISRGVYIFELWDLYSFDPGLTTPITTQGAQSMKKRIQREVLRALLLAICAAVVSCVAAAQSHKPISLAGPEAKLPFSDGMVAGNTLYIAGQEGRTADGKLAEGGIAGETRAALEAVEKVVKAAGFEMKDIVSVTVYLADIKDFDEMNKTYKSILPDPKPARATVQVSALVGAAHIEISAIAVK